MELARWVVFGSGIAAFVFWVMQWAKARQGRSESGRRTNPAGRAGLLIEVLGAMVLILWPVPHPAGLPAWLYAAAGTLAISSALFGIVGGVHLGRQMRVQAVVTEEHKLITSGPYAIVRHPIYTSVLGLFFAAALVFAHPLALVVAGPIFVIGTELRMRAEDKLLAAHFGPEFEGYRRRVSAYLPGIR
jgi:protein-S-isoprenylcysteine O-methyltransferase Ste14